MFTITRALIESESKLPTAKSTQSKSNIKVFDALKLTCVNLVSEIVDWSVYDAAHWVCNIDRWLTNRSPSNNNQKTYSRGEIVFLDLGAQNFKFEPSYTHACIVLANRRSSILIVPCSTKKYGSGYPDIIDATPADGFHRNTGIQSESFRWVHKNRIVSQTGKKVDPSILDKLDQVLLSLAPSVKRDLNKLHAHNQVLTQQVQALQAHNQALTQQVQALQAQIQSSSTSSQNASTDNKEYMI